MLLLLHCGHVLAPHCANRLSSFTIILLCILKLRMTVFAVVFGGLYCLDTDSVTVMLYDSFIFGNLAIWVTDDIEC